MASVRKAEGIMSIDIIPARSGVAIKDTMSASGHGIMRCRKVKIGWAATRFLYRRK